MRHLVCLIPLFSRGFQGGGVDLAEGNSCTGCAFPSFSGTDTSDGGFPAILGGPEGTERLRGDNSTPLEQLLLSSPAQFFCYNAMNPQGAFRQGRQTGWGSDAAVVLLELDALMDRCSHALIQTKMKQHAEGRAQQVAAVSLSRPE